jgi:rod shape-determining protein MreC
MAAALALGLMITDSRYQHLDFLRATLAVTLYPLQYLAALPSRLARAVDGRLANEAVLRERNQTLQDENLRLRARMQTFQSLETENRRLRTLLGSSFQVGKRVLIAELLEVELDPFRQQVIVDKGLRAGVYTGQPVLDANAVMGQVIRTNPLTSTVLLITDPAHSLPVQVNRSGLRAIADGTGLINRLRLSHLPEDADIRVGDLLVTSGLGGVFPRGYPVARVIGAGFEPHRSQFATVLAEPTARLDRSHEVLLVWTESTPPPARAAPPDMAAASATTTSRPGVDGDKPR